MTAAKRSYPLPYRKPGTVYISFQGLRRALFAVTLLILAGIVFVIIRGTPLQRGKAALVEAFSTRRLIEPRLSGDFKAAPYDSSPEDEAGVNGNKLLLANDLIQDVVVTNDPNAHLAYGQLLLCKGSKGSDALKSLRLAVKDLAGKPEPHNDLGVCLIQRGKLEDAIEEFDLALKLNSDMSQALFNRALCYQRLHLTNAARADLSRVASIERDPGWRAEINWRLNELTSSIKKPLSYNETISALTKALDAGNESAAHAIVSNYYERVQTYAQTLVKDHLQAVADHDDAKADQVLSRIETLGEMGRKVRGDNSLAATAEYLRSLPVKEKQPELKLINEYTEARKKFEAKKYREAQPILEALRNKYKQRKNYLYELRATHIAARCQYHLNNFSASIKTLEDCLRMSEEHGWLQDYSRALINLGLSYSRRGQDSIALKCYQGCSKLYKEMKDSEAKPMQVIGMAYWHLGNLDEALHNLQTSTNLLLGTTNDPFELAYNYLNIADIYRLSDKHALALLFAQEALRISDGAQDMNRAAQASSFIALEQANLGQFDTSEESLKGAFEYRDKVVRAELEYTEPLIYIRAGEAALLEGDTAKAVEYYSRAEALAANIEGNIIPHINALRGRAEAEEAAGQREKARDDLQLAIDRIENYRCGLNERDHRVEFLDASQSVFDQLIALEMDGEERTMQAFDVSEKSRARGLLDDISVTTCPSAKDAELKSGSVKTVGNNPTPETLLGLDRVQAELPADLTLLVYSVTNQRIYTFIISKTQFDVAVSNTTSARLARMVGDYVSEIRAKADLTELKEKAGELYQLLIPPAVQRLPKDTTICVVPDKSLHFLPFQALCDLSGHYLIESYILTYAPSASVLIRCIQMDSVKAIAVGPERFLAVGNPKFNRDLYPNLGDLNEAKSEAEESARGYTNSQRGYTNSRALVDGEATEVAVREAMRQCNVAHFAVHCLVKEQSPWKAALVLAPSPPGDTHSHIKPEANSPNTGPDPHGAMTKRDSYLPDLSPGREESEDDPNDGLLSLKEIYNLSLPHMRLVVLSACQSGIGQYYRGEGIVSLIHPFISARVSTVVASLWPVESQATSSLMISFHKERLKMNVRSGAALRTAQLRMIENGDYADPYYWASFVVVGGNY